ncbi:MAG: hypothetical protein IJR14_04920 [Synergistaceae bacterium]|nr:hypothetical protein [Synergistaceae bacterium]
MIGHVILEVCCLFEFPDEDVSSETQPLDLPSCRRNGEGWPGVHCLFGKCPYAGFTDAPDELAFSDANGNVDFSDDSSWIGFGGEMEPNGISEPLRCELKKLWAKIAKRKIDEAYDLYMDEMRSMVPLSSEQDGPYDLAALHLHRLYPADDLPHPARPPK